MAQYIQRGETLNYTATTAVAVNEVVNLGSRIGVAADNIAKGTTGAVHVVGVFSFPVADGETFTQGQAVYWNGTAITATADKNTPAGYVFETLTNGVAVKIG